jgi:hypothetical protein
LNGKLLFQNEKIEFKNKETDHFSEVGLEIGVLNSCWAVVVNKGIQIFPSGYSRSPLNYVFSFMLKNLLRIDIRIAGPKATA